MNAERLNERGYLQGALKRMHDRKLPSYHSGGVTLILVAGEEKLRVRVDQGAPATGNAPDSEDAE